MRRSEVKQVGVIGAVFLLICAGLFCLSPEDVRNFVERIPVVSPASDETIQTEPASEAIPAAALNFENIQLDVAPVMQLPEMPNGCEITSLTAVLRYYGFDVSKEEMALEYLPYEFFSFDGFEAVAPDPDEAYAGDPFGVTYAFYCFASPIVQAANEYFDAVGADYTALDVTGAEFEDLVYYLQEGRPVIIWATLDFQEPVYSGFWWKTEDGEIIEAYSNLHCLVLKGYDGISVSLCDPLIGNTIVRKNVFIQCYEAMQQRAVVLDRAPDAD